MKLYILLGAYLFASLISVACSSESSQTNNMNISIYWVNSHKVPCEGVAPMQCLQIKKAENESWQYFYSQIAGFDFEPGYLYKIEVREEKLDPKKVPADASSVKYTLVSVIEKNEDPFYTLFGTFKGTIPCADCEGIETALTLAVDGTYTLDSRYLGRQEEPFNESGKFELDRETSMVLLHSGDGAMHSYKLEGEILFHLDKQGNRIQGDLAEHYQLIKKITDPDLEDREVDSYSPHGSGSGTETRQYRCNHSIR